MFLPFTEGPVEKESVLELLGPERDLREMSGGFLNGFLSLLKEMNQFLLGLRVDVIGYGDRDHGMRFQRIQKMATRMAVITNWIAMSLMVWRSGSFTSSV